MKRPRAITPAAHYGDMLSAVLAAKAACESPERLAERQDAFERWILIQSKREPLFPTDLTMNSDWSRYVSAQTQAYWLAFEAGADFGFMQG